MTGWSNATIDRVETVDTTFATLNYQRFRNVVFESNTFNGVTQITASPVMVEHVQVTAADTWTVNAGAFLPFAARARNVQPIVAEGPVTTATGAQRFDMPYAQVEQGAQFNLVALRWPVPVRGVMR